MPAIININLLLEVCEYTWWYRWTKGIIQKVKCHTLCYYCNIYAVILSEVCQTANLALCPSARWSCHFECNFMIREPLISGSRIMTLNSKWHDHRALGHRARFANLCLTHLLQSLCVYRCLIGWLRYKSQHIIVSQVHVVDTWSEPVNSNTDSPE